MWLDGTYPDVEDCEEAEAILFELAAEAEVHAERAVEERDWVPTTPPLSS